MPDSTPPPMSLASADGKLVAHFFWQHDRYAHRIENADGQAIFSIEANGQDTHFAAISAAAAKVFAGPSDDWPYSPPLQQLSLEQINGAPAILGVGSAGRGHWSISVEPTESGLRFDVACRSKSSPLWLGNSYSFCKAMAVLPTQDSNRWVHDNGDSAAPNTIRWCSVSPSSTKPSATTRWDYEIT